MKQETEKFQYGDLQIAPSDIEDLPYILKIEQRSFTDPWTFKNFEDTFSLNYAIMLTAKIKNEVAGYCCLYHIMDEGEIVNVAIDPRFRRAGVGMKMLSCLIECGRNAGVQRFLLDVRVSNEGAVSLYEKAGFKKVVKQKNFYEKPVEDAWLMELM